MTVWLQHLLVLVLVAACLAMVGRQLIGTFRGRQGAKLGSCCATGCDAQSKTSDRENHERIVFIPSSSLMRRR